MQDVKRSDDGGSCHGWKCKLKLRCMHEYCTRKHYFFFFFFFWVGGGGGGVYRKVGGRSRSQTNDSLFFWNCRCFRTSLSATVLECMHRSTCSRLNPLCSRGKTLFSNTSYFIKVTTSCNPQGIPYHQVHCQVRHYVIESY